MPFMAVQQENPNKRSGFLSWGHGKVSVRENRGKVTATWALKVSQRGCLRLGIWGRTLSAPGCPGP